MDKVVFQTGLFISDISKLVEKDFGINQTLFNSQIPNYYKKGNGNLRLYDFFDHIEKLGLNTDIVESTIISRFSSKDYSYADVPKFLEFIHTEIETDTITILTYGETRFQQLKYNCSPILNKLNYVDTLRPKAEYIKNTHTNNRGIVIDDKIIDNLPLNFKQVWLTRPSVYPKGGGFKSLDEIRSNWTAIDKTIN